MGDQKRREDAQAELLQKIEAYKVEDPLKDLTITIIAGLWIIGEVKEDGTIYRPRRIQVIQNPQDPKQVLISIEQLVGEPELLEDVNLRAVGFKYKVKNEQVINLYIQQVSGLLIASSNVLQMPPGRS